MFSKQRPAVCTPDHGEGPLGQNRTAVLHQAPEMQSRKVQHTQNVDHAGLLYRKSALVIWFWVQIPSRLGHLGIESQPEGPVPTSVQTRMFPFARRLLKPMMSTLRCREPTKQLNISTHHIAAGRSRHPLQTRGFKISEVGTFPEVRTRENIL